MVDITATANLVLTGWEDGTTTYCPLVFTVNGTEFKVGDGGITTAAELEAAVETAFVDALAANDVDAYSRLDRSVEMTWSWPFDVNPADPEPDEADINDTLLGNMADDGNAPTISFEYEVTVEQVD
jgi:hypothetical protein